MKYYILDSTLPSREPTTFNTIPEIVRHLEGTVQRKFRKTRSGYMNDLVSIGHPYDDSAGQSFTEALSEVFNIGVVRHDRLVKCNIHEAAKNNKNKVETGD